MKFETRAIHVGQEPDPGTGATITPIHQSPSRGGMYPQPWAFDDAAAPADKQQSRPLQRHQGGCNFAYADGHAKWSRLEKTWRSYSDKDWRRNPTP